MSESPRGETAAGLLAQAAAQTELKSVAEDIRGRVVDILIDTLGVMAAGSDREPHRKLQGLLSTGAGRATVIGRRSPAPAAIAAVLNGTTPTVYQIDEGHRESRGHPGIHVIPAVLALAEERNADADALLSAILAGYEVASRIGQSLGGTKPDIHPHGNWGTIGAAVACAHLLARGHAEVIATAIDMAAAVTLYPDRLATTTGSGVHHLYPSLGTHIGLVSAEAAFAGITATPGCLENFMAPRSGVAFDRDLLLSGIDRDSRQWSRFNVLSSYFKFWPACAHTHTVINALQALRDEVPFDARDVDRIDIRAFRAAAGLTVSRIADDNDLAARYSIPYVAAAAIIDAPYDLDSLRPEILASPLTEALAGRVHLRHDPDLDAGYPAEGRPVHVEVRLTDGRTLTADKTISFGDVEIPAQRHDVWSKAERLFAHRFGAQPAASILTAAQELETGGPIEKLSAALRDAATD